MPTPGKYIFIFHDADLICYSKTRSNDRANFVEDGFKCSFISRLRRFVWSHANSSVLRNVIVPVQHSRKKVNRPLRCVNGHGFRQIELQRANKSFNDLGLQFRFRYNSIDISLSQQVLKGLFELTPVIRENIFYFSIV